MLKTLINNDNDKLKFVENFGMFQLTHGNSTNNFPTSKENIILEQYSHYDEFKIENIPLSIFKESFNMINYECNLVTMKLMMEKPIYAYLITGKINKAKILKDCEDIIVRNLTYTSEEWLKNNKTELTTILFIPVAGIFFHPIFFYNNNGNIIYQPIDSKYLMIDYKNNQATSEGWLQSFKYIIEIYSIQQKIVNIIDCYHLPNNEICLPPNYWNNKILNIDFKKEGTLLANRYENIQNMFKNWNELDYQQKIKNYNELILKDTTNRKYCKCIIPFLLYKNVEHSNEIKYINTDHLKIGEEIIIKVFTNNELNPELEKLNIIKISKIDFKEYENLNKYLQEAMNIIKLKMNNQNQVRKNDGMLGKMFAFGETSKSFVKDNPIALYKDTYKLSENNLLSNLMKEYTTMFNNVFPLETSVIKKYAACYNELIPKEMGGSNGITKTMNCSRNLINPPHIDASDLGISISLWTELIPGDAKNWEFIFPSCKSKTTTENFNGIIIGLNHGVVISWDGNLKHCSTVGDILDENGVFGWQVTNNIVHLNNFMKIRNQKLKK